MFNKVILVGNLTRDIELRYLQSGTAVGSTGIATNRRYKSNDGSQKEEVMFIDLTFFGRTAEVANQYLKKGSKILVEGRLRLDSWEDQNGAKRSKHSITVDNMQMLDSRGDMSQQNSATAYSQPTQQSYSNPSIQSQPINKQENTSPSIPEIDIDDDEIPF